jgi:single-stranded-DNA-specific exonuclease
MNMETSEFREKEISERFHTGVLLARLMTAASLSDDQITELMDPDMHLSDSEAPCITACCERILLAAKNKEKVFIGGDYDADGICSTAIMKKTLDRLGIVNGYYIPDRFREGYGLSEKTVRLAHEKGYSLIITVDNGIKAYYDLQGRPLTVPHGLCIERSANGESRKVFM